MNSLVSMPFFGFTKEYLKQTVCPILLAASVCFACIYTFHKPSAYILTAVFTVSALFLFRLFDKLRKKKRGGLIYAVILAVTLFTAYSIDLFHKVSFGWYEPMRWFYAQDDINSFQPDLIFALFLGGGFFLISVIYYFTVVRYRTLGIMLCTLFPFFIYAKRSDIMPNILSTLIVLLFLAVIIHNRRLKESDKRTFLQADKAYLICISVFILITGAITVAVEKPYHQAYLEKNSGFLNSLGLSMQGSSGYERLSDTSSPRNSQPNYNYEPLFYFETDSEQGEIFLRTKAFDRFNGDVFENSEPMQYYFSMQVPEYSTDDVLEDFSALYGKDLSSYCTVFEGRLSDEDFTPEYLPSPFGIITDDRPINAMKFLKSNTDTSVLRNNLYYYLAPLNDSFTFNEPSSRLYALADELNYSAEEYIKYLDSFSENEHASRLKADYLRAREKYTDKTGISERLADLSEKIVSSCRNDIQKAQALGRYFSENGFMYSLEYAPRDNSVDYFVFESKTGYCAGYATAMTLMARSVGLPARYVEGFAAFEKGADGRFVIRDGYAHAFVEIYIPAVGWLTFDPTVSEYKNIPEQNGGANGFGFLTRIFGVFNRISVIIVIGAAVLLYALSDRIRELFFIISLYFKPMNERIILLYNNLLSLAGKSEKMDFSSYTPDMLRDFLKERRGICPEKLISLFERVAFGKYNCEKGEYKAAFSEYIHTCRKIRKPEFRRKKDRARSE